MSICSPVQICQIELSNQYELTERNGIALLQQIWVMSKVTVRLDVWKTSCWPLVFRMCTEVFYRCNECKYGRVDSME